MWNNTNNSSSTVFNAPATGIIQKSNKDSVFITMHQKSKLADSVFGNDPEYNDKRIVVLQVLLTHESWFLVEIINKDKFAEPAI